MVETTGSLTGWELGTFKKDWSRKSRAKCVANFGQKDGHANDSIACPF